MYEKKLLVATKAITDPIFAGSVVLLFKNDEQGSAGAILNSGNIVGKIAISETDPEKFMPLLKDKTKLTEKVKEMLFDKNNKDIPILAGGPCASPHPYFLHGYEEFAFLAEEEPEFNLGIPSTFDTGCTYKDSNPFHIIDGLYFGDPSTIVRIVQAGKLKEGKFHALVGFSGWAPGQLEREIEMGAWEIIEPDAEWIFDQKELEKLVKDAGGIKANKVEQPEMTTGILSSIFPPLPANFNPEWN